MYIVKELIALAQHIDDLGLTKEADTLDEVAHALSKQADEDSLDFDLLGESMQSYLDKGLSTDDALVQAVEELETN